MPPPRCRRSPYTPERPPPLPRRLPRRCHTAMPRECDFRLGPAQSSVDLMESMGDLTDIYSRAVGVWGGGDVIDAAFIEKY